jgi:hypothetical protein
MDQADRQETGLIKPSGRKPVGPDLPFPWIDYDPYTGIWMKYVRGDHGKWHIEYIQDVEAQIEFNKTRQNDGSNGYGPSRELQHVAHIPDIISLKWRNDHGIETWNKDHWPKVKRMLNDPDWKYLRTIPGKV